MIKILENLYDLTVAKNTDYGNSFMKGIEEFGLLTSIIRIGDKINRINKLTTSNNLVKNETILDTYQDLLNYSLLTILFLNNGYLENKDLYDKYKELCEHVSKFSDDYKVIYNLDHFYKEIKNIYKNDNLQMYATLEPYLNIVYTCLNKLTNIK